MIQSQTAIVPEPGPFALYVLLKVTGDSRLVMQSLRQVGEWVGEINHNQPGANLTSSIAFSHDFWSSTFEQAPPLELKSFPRLEGGEQVAPTTEADIYLHCHSHRHDLHFYLLRKLMQEISQQVEVVDETYGYKYLDSRDMTDFVDGTENPKGADRADVALVAEGEFEGGSYVMVQRFIHALPAWNALSVSQQEKIVGRTKPDSIELDDVDAQSHVGRVDIKKKVRGLRLYVIACHTALYRVSTAYCLQLIAIP